ncbi:hypothetical protein [Terrimonas pollutisoli]|uniref:hypothetical protein n=1 Tax=Terrimonas pollutisoli TaxID=3034147 RepID=UPI0023ECBE18|nr:hypothetical protein [Terrimonas sp. H1YJ31]
MTVVIQIVVTVLFTLLLSCNTHTNNANSNALKATDSINKGSSVTTMIDTPRSFVKNYDRKDNPLFVFVGEKISVQPLPHEQGSIDNGFTAKYIILQKVYGDFPLDTIEFVVYDHYGVPDFSKYKNVLLFVSADSGTYYHQKYMYNDVYKTKGGRWAGTYTYEDYNHAYNKLTKVKPVKIEFAEEVSYPTRMVDEEGRQMTFSYPKPYFKTVSDKAIAVYGNYIEDLFKLKKDGVLTARGLFGSKRVIP